MEPIRGVGYEVIRAPRGPDDTYFATQTSLGIPFQVDAGRVALAKGTTQAILSYADSLGEVFEYRQLSNHPELESATNQREVSADGRRVQRSTRSNLSGGQLESCFWQFDGLKHPQLLLAGVGTMR